MIVHSAMKPFWLMYDVVNPNYVIELRYNNFRQKGTEKEIEALKGTKTKE